MRAKIEAPRGQNSAASTGARQASFATARLSLSFAANCRRPSTPPASSCEPRTRPAVRSPPGRPAGPSRSGRCCQYRRRTDEGRDHASRRQAGDESRRFPVAVGDANAQSFAAAATAMRGIERDITEQHVRIGRLKIIDALKLARHIPRVVATCLIKAWPRDGCCQVRLIHNIRRADR